MRGGMNAPCAARTAFHHSRHDGAAALTWILLPPLSVMLSLPLLCFAWMREDPFFWQNAGGYPIWLRTVVLFAFHPLLALNLSILLALTCVFIRRPASTVQVRWIQAGVLAALWLLVVIAVLIAAANNITNIIAGRPLHSHW